MFYLFVIVGPSGVGKTTLANLICKKFRKIKQAVSHTTRPKRPSEKDGVDYHFVSGFKFRLLKEQDEFFEWTSINNCNYGLTWDSINTSKRHKLVIVDIEGAKKIKRVIGVGSKIIFVNCRDPKSTLRDRLKKRGETDAWIERRIDHSSKQIQFYNNNESFFDYALINDDLKLAFKELKAKIEEFMSEDI